MHILPIVERELRVASRRSATYYTRITACGIIMFFFLPLLFNPLVSRAPQRMGPGLFENLAWITFAIAMFAGIGATADCISSEKRDGTLGLLFLTDLTGFDIVMGKLVANSLGVIYGLLGTIPFFAVTILLGGVTLKQVALVGLAVLNAAFFSLAASLLASTVNWDARRAGSAAFGLLLFFIGLLPGCVFGVAAYLNYKGFSIKPESLNWVFLVNPGYAFAQLTSGFGGGFSVGSWFWPPLLTSHGLAWVFIGLASRIAPRTWQDNPATAARQRWRDRWRNWLQGDAGRRRLYRQHLLALNPITWLAARDRLKPVYPWCFLGLAAIVWLTGAYFLKMDWLTYPVAVCTIVLLNLVLRMWLASEATLCFGHNMRTGAMELILSTSLSVEEILHGQFLALRRQFLGPALAVLCTDAAMTVMVLVYDRPRNGGDQFATVFAAGSAMAMFALDMYVLSWVGMWQGLIAKDMRQAGGRAISSVLFLPVVWYMAFMFLTAFSRIRTPSGVVLMSWFGIGLFVTLYYWNKAKSQLEEEFRSLAMRRYSGEKEKTFLEKVGLVAS
jgi:ABC-type transport system involved in cytochrome c biogenesis permease component